MSTVDLPPGSVRPKYGSYCISGIPSTVMHLLGVRPPGTRLPSDALGDVELSGIDKVVLLVADGFGMNEWRRQRREGLVKSVSARGSVRPITTVFPSTTSAALTTLATGLTPQEHALPEWFVYLKEVNSVVVTLPYGFIQDPRRETLKGHLNPRSLFSGTPVFKELKGEGVATYSFTARWLVDTTYTKLVHGASRLVPYSGSSDMVASLRRSVESASGPSFFYVYWSRVDTVEHEFGPNTDESELEASSISFALQKGFVEKLDRRAARSTLLIITADHGQINVDIDRTLYLNRFRSLVKSFRKNGLGRPITPAGNARDVFLYVEQEKEEHMLTLLRRRLRGTATVLRTEDAIRAGLFGLNEPSRKFRDRVGNILVLPHGTRTIWFKGERGYDIDLRGHHGGLTTDEMTVPLAVGRLSDLQR